MLPPRPDNGAGVGQLPDQWSCTNSGAWGTPRRGVDIQPVGQVVRRMHGAGVAVRRYPALRWIGGTSWPATGGSPHRCTAAGVVGQPGRTHALGDGLWEMRIDYGPGYRLYYIREGAEVIVLLCGGDKDTQSRDIERARQLAGERS